MLNALDIKISDKAAGSMLEKLLEMMRDTMSSDLYNQITKRTGSNPTKALEKLLNSAEFINEVDKSKAATDFFLGYMIKLEQVSHYPKKLVEILINSDTFVNVLSKASTKVQDRLIV